MKIFGRLAYLQKINGVLRKRALEKGRAPLRNKNLMKILPHVSLPTPVVLSCLSDAVLSPTEGLHVHVLVCLEHRK